MQTFFNQLDENKVKTVLWGHNYYYSDYCNRIANCNAIKANVFVGRQQYDRYVDHKIILKSTYIYNMYPMEKKQKRKFENQHTVTYIGSLVPEKGFQVLAAAWKKIIAEVPDAQLNVIGSGKLYSRNSKLGKYKIAEEHFENQFMRYLISKLYGHCMTVGLLQGNARISTQWLAINGKKDVILANNINNIPKHI